MQLWTLSSGLWMCMWLCVDHTHRLSHRSHESGVRHRLSAFSGLCRATTALDGHTPRLQARAPAGARGRGARGWPPWWHVLFFPYSLYSVIGVFSPLVRFSTHSTESHTNEGVPNILIRPVVSAVGPCPKLIRSSVLGPRQPPQKPNRVPRHVTAPLRPSTTRGASRELAR